jgi:hypothetical protein
MRRLIPFAVLVLAAPAVISAPVPKPESAAERLRKAVGATVYPDKGCEFVFDGTTLTAKLPKERVGHPEEFRMGMRTAKEVTGDFEFTVLMRTTAPQDLPAGANRKWQPVGGGIGVWNVDDKPAKLEVSLSRWFNRERLERNGPVVWTEQTQASYPGTVYQKSDDDPADPQRPLYLRLTRRGNDIATATSSDGKEWAERANKVVDFGKTVTVGVSAFNGTGQPVEILFEKFSLRPLK